MEPAAGFTTNNIRIKSGRTITMTQIKRTTKAFSFTEIYCNIQAKSLLSGGHAALKHRGAALLQGMAGCRRMDSVAEPLLEQRNLFIR